MFEILANFENIVFSAEIANQLKDCETKCIVTFPLFVPIVQHVISSTPELAGCQVIVIGEPTEGCHTFSEMLKTDSSSAKLVKGSDIDTQNDTAALLYSSGTTV